MVYLYKVILLNHEKWNNSTYICMHAKLFQSCLTLYNLMDYSLPGSSVNRIFQARTLEWVAMSSSRGSSWTRVRNHVSCFIHWQAGYFPLVPLGKPLKKYLFTKGLFFSFLFLAVCMLSCFSFIWIYNLWTVAHQALWNFPGKNTGVCCHALLPVSSWLRDRTHVSYICGIDRQVLYQ